MTQALCLKCGAFKIGAFTPCHECGFSPKTVEDKAKGMIMTDWHFNSEQLEEYSSRIKAGETLTFGEETLARFVTYIKTGKFPEET
jgi:hypothetical protein